MRERQTIGLDVIRLVGDVADQCGKWLPAGHFSLAGEVLDVWRRDGRWEITLADTDRDDVAITATLPLSEPRPRVGYTLAILGRYRLDPDSGDASFRLVFEGDQRNPDWVSRESSRRRKRRDVIERLLARGPRADLLTDPLTVALVTSPGSSAVDDFKAGLEGLADEVACEQVAIPLESGSAFDIADGIRRAGDLPVDIVVVARGGGSKIMLERFSHEAVVEAVADVALRIPVVMAVGHERDRVDAEHVAWQRVATPGHAGTLVAREIRIRRARRRRTESVSMPMPAARISVHAVDAPGREFAPQRGSSRWRPGRLRRRTSARAVVFLLILAAVVYAGFSSVRLASESDSQSTHESWGLHVPLEDRARVHRAVRVGKPRIELDKRTQPVPTGNSERP